VGQQEIQGRLAEFPVELQGTVVPDRAVDQGEAGGQEQHQQDQVHPSQAGNNSCGSESGGV
jgi:hypothetical protein